MPYHENSRAPTAFICFRGVYECTRVPMGLLPSANFFQKSMSYYVFREPLYQICEVYIDDLLVYGHDDDDFGNNVRTIFQKCRDKTVTQYTWSASLIMVGGDSPQTTDHSTMSSQMKGGESQHERDAYEDWV